MGIPRMKLIRWLVGVLLAAAAIVGWQQDVSRITGVRVLEREEISPDEARMKVYPEGAGTWETISMNRRAGGDWKFGGVTRTQRK